MRFLKKEIYLKNEILEYLKHYKEKYKNKYHIKKIGIFGSFAKNIDTKKSDIDIVVDFYKADLLAQVGIMNDLKEHFKKDVDVIVYWDKMNPRLKKRIKKEAIYV